MAWLSEGLPSLSSLKGQITNFTKEVLSDGIVTEIENPRNDLDEANAKCTQLQELLDSKEIEISILRRQNTELQKAVVDLNAKTGDTKSNNQDAESGSFFWDPTGSKSREIKDNNQTKSLQEQLAQATLKIRELESELHKFQAGNVREESYLKEEAGPSKKTELLRAKQDMMNRIIQIGEKSREAERNVKRLQQDELTLVADFRSAISKLASPDQCDMIKAALLALGHENDKFKNMLSMEKLDCDEKSSLREAELRKQIEQLKLENRNLVAGIDELDKQNSESIEQILALKEDLQNKHHSLQIAYERLYMDYNEVSEKLEILQNQKVTSYESNKSILSNNNDSQTETVAKQDKVVSVDLISEFQIKQLEKVKDILGDASLQLNDAETFYEGLAKQFVQLNLKKCLLERKLHETNIEFKEVTELKDSLQIDCEDMQANIESLLAQIQHLKSNLPSIPEASEERVASLETETESLQEELTTLRKSNSKLSSELRSIKSSLKENNINIPESQLIESDMKSGDELMETLKEENSALRRRIDVLESEIKMYIEKCKSVDENIELIEELKLDVENAKRELKIAISNNKRLENSMSILQEAKTEVDADNEVLVREKEQLEHDLALLKNSDLKKEEGKALAKIREEITKISQDKKDLEYDINNMRNELDLTLEELEYNKTLNENLSINNEGLLKENHKLLEQFDEIRKESLDKTELLTTEISLLQQELDSVKKELSDSLTKLKENQKLKNEIKILSKGAEEWEKVFLKLKSLQEKVLVLESNNKSLRNEVAVMEKLEKQNEKLKRDFNEKEHELIVIKENMDEIFTKLKFTEEQLVSVEKENNLLKSKLPDFSNVRESDYKKLYEELVSEYRSKMEILKAVESKNQLLNEKWEHSVVNKCDSQCDTQELLMDESNAEQENERLKCLLDQKCQEIDMLKVTVESSKESASMAKETVENLSTLISAKDSELETLKISFNSLQTEKDEFLKTIQEKDLQNMSYQGDVQKLSKILDEQTTNFQRLINEKQTVIATLHEKENQLLWTKNELEVTRNKLKSLEERNNFENQCGITEHSLLNSQLATVTDKLKSLESTLLQEQSNLIYLQEQLQESQNKEAAACKEVERLRNHLVEVESSHNEEALQSEEIQKTLEAKLVQLEEQLKNSSTIYTSANVRANQQVETLQQQLNLIVQQRDDLQNKLSMAEDKMLSSTASLTNLQLVLEQFQRDKEKDIQVASEKIYRQLEDSYKKNEELNKEIAELKSQLEETKECLLAASRLTELIDKKSEKIDQLNQEVARLNDLVATADDRIEEARRSGEGKVDKSLVKNLLLGYISSSPNDKVSVLRVVATVLDFNETEREKSGLNTSSSKNSWFSSLVNSGAPNSKEQEASLSAAFVKFLENESQPKPQLPALPISNSTFSKPGHSRQNSSSSTKSTLLLNVDLPTFDFVPARNTGSILKEVLKDS